MRRSLTWVFLFSILLWILIFVLFFGIAKKAFGAEIISMQGNTIEIYNTDAEKTTNNNEEYKKRSEAYRKDVLAEVKRHHELLIREKEIEVLGRLEILKSSNTFVNAINSNTTQTSSLSNTGQIRSSEIKNVN